MVKDINPGGSGCAAPSYLTNVNGVLFFIAANQYCQVKDLWRSDGTAQGTYLVKAFTGSSDPNQLTNVSGVLYFSASDGIYGAPTFYEELWRSDSTVHGTYMVKDINPTGSSRPSGLTNVNGVLHFLADDGVGGDDLWRSDATPEGTYIV